MTDSFVQPEFLAYVAGACYALGLLIINQITLRLMVLAGTAFYILYYFAIADEPLWEAIYISVLIGCANLFGLASLVVRNSPLAIPRAHRDLYSHFPGLPPGDFRTMLRLSKRAVADEPMVLTTENAPVSKLYYIIDGATLVSKKDDKFQVPCGTFVGEVAFMTKRPASASTILQAGSEYLEWSVVDLQQTCDRSARFKLALDAVLSRDLAAKVARSVAPYDSEWRPELAPYPVSSHPAQSRRIGIVSPER